MPGLKSVLGASGFHIEMAQVIAPSVKDSVNEHGIVFEPVENQIGFENDVVIAGKTVFIIEGRA